MIKINHFKVLSWVAVFSFALAIIGFILDLHERVDSIVTNILEIGMMTALIFTFCTLVYVSILLVLYAVTKLKNSSRI